MQRFFTAIFATSITVATASAGTISVASPTQIANQNQIGGINGLTAGYIASGTDGGTWAERNYDVKLFSSAKEGSVAPTVGSNGTPSTFTDSANGITFNAINDGSTVVGPNNYWQPCTGVTCNSPIALTVMVGLADPSEVWTMLNNNWGSPGAQQTTVEFDFTDAGTAETLFINLVNAYNNGGTGGQIRSSIDCTTNGNNCTSYAGANGSALASSTTINGVTVLTGNVFNTAYNSIAAGSQYTGSAGILNLDDQGFVFGSATDGLGHLYSSDYLVDVKIIENSGAANTSETAVSAITVVTPEPSTIFLVLAGFGAVGFSRLRRRAA